MLLKGYQNGSIKVDKTKQQQVDLNIGMAISGFCDTALFTLMPEISGECSHTIWNKGNQVKIRNLINQTILSQKINSNKGTLKLAANLSILTDVFEINGGYEHSIQQKSKTRLGHIKLRINF